MRTCTDVFPTLLSLRDCKKFRQNKGVYHHPLIPDISKCRVISFEHCTA
uniref:Uncharacterized protein n=1 Tax=Arundo donax TaxID=35708 RepID=A0A0A9F8C8_ARUDO